MRSNIPFHHPKQFTHEGGRATTLLTPLQQLRRSVLSCLLFENEFYEDGQTISSRIVEFGNLVKVGELADLAVKARNDFNLRHVPLVLLSVLSDRAKGTALVSTTIPLVVRRADELAEFLAVRQKITGEKEVKLTHQIRKGLARAFNNFSAYSLGKYNRDGAIKLRDVLRLTHPKPKDYAQAITFKELNENRLASPDTWEVNLSAGADKKETFTRLIQEGKLGYFALLRNLRNMVQAGVDLDLVREAILARQNGAEKVLPFRFTAAARIVPQLEPELDKALCQTIGELPKISGLTAVLVDVSGSMEDKLSAKSDLTRMDAAATLASIINGNCRVFTFSNGIVEVPPRKGMAGVDAIIRSQSHQGTYLRGAMEVLNAQVKYDRLIVITDEQSQDGNGEPVSGTKGYLINVASNRNGVGYGAWVHVDGFSEQVIRFIVETEK